MCITHLFGEHTWEFSTFPAVDCVQNSAALSLAVADTESVIVPICSHLDFQIGCFSGFFKAFEKSVGLCIKNRRLVKLCFMIGVEILIILWYTYMEKNFGGFV